MKIIINNSSEIPIYEQIKQAIINHILSHELSVDDSLPSIRNLAKDIRVSVMTVKKAYDDLENEGYIITKHGKGSFVAAKNLTLVKDKKINEIECLMSKIIDLSNYYNINKEEIIELFESMCGGKK